MKNSGGFNCEPRLMKSKVISIFSTKREQFRYRKQHKVIEKQKFKESAIPEADEPTSLSGLLMKSRRFIDEPA